MYVFKGTSIPVFDLFNLCSDWLSTEISANPRSDGEKGCQMYVSMSRTVFFTFLMIVYFFLPFKVKSLNISKFFLKISFHKILVFNSNCHCQLCTVPWTAEVKKFQQFSWFLVNLAFVNLFFYVQEVKIRYLLSF